MCHAICRSTATYPDSCTRPMRDDTQESAPTSATSVESHLPSVAMYAHTRSCTNRSSLSHASLTTVESSSHSLATSRSVTDHQVCFSTRASGLTSFKSHQNKFHANTLKYLTQKFATIREGDPVTYQDKELWEYFSQLYKNSNKGIKGRGKDRRIWTVPSSNASTSSYASHNPSMSQDDRSSRSSSYVSAHEMTHYHVPHQQHAHFEDHSGYGNMVFPER